MLTNALVVDAPGSPFVHRQVTVEDEPRDDEVMVEMHATGLCHTDLNFSKESSIPNLFPAILGHEGAGIVIKTGAKVTKTVPGDHVVLTYSSCGNCKFCWRKESSYCYDFEKANFGPGRMDGTKSYSLPSGLVTSHFFGQSSFARHAIVAASGLVVVNKTLPLEQLAPLGCGIMTGAGAMLNVVQPKSDWVVCVAGAGAVGLAAIMALKLLPSPPAVVIAIDVVSRRLELAKKYGVTKTIDSSGVVDLKQALVDATDGKGIDGSIDTTGRPEVVKALLQASAHRGTVVQVGVGSLTAEVSTSLFETVNSGRTYRGCAMGSCYPQEFIPELIRAWEKGIFPFADITKHYSARNIESAVQDVRSGNVIKAVLMWEEEKGDTFLIK
ncbi:aryl-alcohol dehydrogenase [Dactylonectria estremocensis]|uniref:Aryl-alcohol dehydrogenase n=1 Tax=Dactylonectria estremocensis TaxID=1079267 RepID=A0A9P9J1V9_9HYPO|nr:aryl-alcohol dehydrogenase [Dactylonectria estremocensis]